MGTAKLTSDAPQFTPDAWNNPAIDKDGSNCFQYAFGGSKPDGSNQVYDEFVPDPGMKSGLINHGNLLRWDSAGLINSVRADGFELHPPTKLPVSPPGSYVVGMYFSEGHDYHWVRQDADGGWSEKPGKGTTVQRYIKPSEDGQYQALPERYHNTNYVLKGYVIVPKEGVDLGIEGFLAKKLRDGSATKVEAGKELSFVEDIIQAYPSSAIPQLAKTLHAKYPDVATKFDEAVTAHYAGLADMLGTQIKEGLTQQQFKERFLDRASKIQMDAISLQLKTRHPEFVQQVETMQHNVIVEEDAKGAIELLESAQIKLLREQLSHLDPKLIREVGAKLAELNPRQHANYDSVANSILNALPKTREVQ
ncbi:MAG: hypothetical protein ACKVOE_02545 [Rickettsiales bacterium]